MKPTTIVFIFILVICWHTYSENADSFYADYCVSFEDTDTNFGVIILLVKEYQTLEPIRLNTQTSFTCKETLRQLEYYSFDSIDKMTGELLKESTSSSVIFMGGSGWSSPGGGILSSTIPINHISKWRILTINGHQKEIYKKELLQLKKIKRTNVNNSIWLYCPPHIDTTFQTYYRVRIVGECESTK